MKTTVKELMVQVLANHGAKLVDGVYNMNSKEFETAKVEIDMLNKFVVKANKKDSTLFAVAYASKKSTNLVLIQTVEAIEETAKPVKKVVKAKKSDVAIKLQMLEDKGVDHHRCKLVFKGSKEKILKFVELVNKFANGYNFLGEATVSGGIYQNDLFEGELSFPKIKGHSKDGYALYRKCMTEAKRELARA